MGCELCIQADLELLILLLYLQVLELQVYGCTPDDCWPFFIWFVLFSLQINTQYVALAGLELDL